MRRSTINAFRAGAASSGRAGRSGRRGCPRTATCGARPTRRTARTCFPRPRRTSCRRRSGPGSFPASRVFRLRETYATPRGPPTRRHRATPSPRRRSRYAQAEREAQEGAHHARVGPRGRPRGEHHGRERAARARPGRHARPAEGTHADDRVAVASADGAEEVKFAFVRLSPRRRRGGAVVSADGWTRSRYRDSDRAEVPASGLLGRLLGTPSPSPPQS